MSELQGIAGGWLEGKNTRGSIGLFPESYVSSVQDSLVSQFILQSEYTCLHSITVSCVKRKRKAQNAFHALCSLLILFEFSRNLDNSPEMVTAPL